MKITQDGQHYILHVPITQAEKTMLEKAVKVSRTDMQSFVRDAIMLECRTLLNAQQHEWDKAIAHITGIQTGGIPGTTTSP